MLLLRPLFVEKKAPKVVPIGRNVPRPYEKKGRTWKFALRITVVGRLSGGFERIAVDVFQDRSDLNIEGRVHLG